MKKLAVLATVALSATSAQAFDWSGAYVGVSGALSLQDLQDLCTSPEAQALPPDQRPSQCLTIDLSKITGGVVAGVNQAVGDIVLGVETTLMIGNLPSPTF